MSTSCDSQTSAVASRSRSEWRACYTRARHEKKVCERLTRDGFQVYLPLVDQVREWHDRTKVVEMPLFPSYLFARFGERELARVLGTAGVATIVRFQDRLGSIPVREIENVRRLVAGLGDSGTLLERCPVFETGDRVRVVAGPFEGIEGTMVEGRGKSRILVAGSETLGQGLRLELEASSLEAVS